MIDLCLRHHGNSCCTRRKIFCAIFDVHGHFSGIRRSIQDGFYLLRSIDSLLVDVEAAAALTHDDKLHTQIVYARQVSKTFLSILKETIHTINSGLMVNDRIPILPWPKHRKRDPSSILLFPRHIFDPIKYPETDCIQKGDIMHKSKFG